MTERQEKTVLEQNRDALHTAYAIIANARNCLGDGDPLLAAQWHEAAQRFMDDYNANLDVYTGYRVSADSCPTTNALDGAE